MNRSLEETRSIYVAGLVWEPPLKDIIIFIFWTLSVGGTAGNNRKKHIRRLSFRPHLFLEKNIFSFFYVPARS